MLMEIRMMIAYPWVHENGDAAAAAISLIPSSTTTTMRRCREPKLCVHLVGSACIFSAFLFLDFNWQKFSFACVFFSHHLPMADPAAGAVEAAVPASCQSVSLLAFEELFLNVTYA